MAACMLPHARMEDWRWTNLRTLIDRPYPPRRVVDASAKDVIRLRDTSPLARIASARLVFVNGTFAPNQSRLPVSGDVAVDAASCRRRRRQMSPLAAMNAAFCNGRAHDFRQSGRQYRCADRVGLPRDCRRAAHDCDADSDRDRRRRLCHARSKPISARVPISPAVLFRFHCARGRGSIGSSLSVEAPERDPSGRSRGRPSRPAQSCATSP